VKGLRKKTGLLYWLVWGYAVLVLSALVVVKLGGDRWWPATLLLFGPRWVMAVPLVVLAPLVIFLNRGLLWPLLAAAIFVFGPFMGLSLPFGKIFAPNGLVLKVLTCNVQNGNFNRKALSSLIFDSGADIVAMQECPRELGLELPPGWHVVQEGQLALLSRFPLKLSGSLQMMHPPHKWPRTSLLYCIVQTPNGAVTLCSVHLPSPRYGLQNILDRRTVLSLNRIGFLVDETENRRQVSRQVQEAIASLPRWVIVAGDFNMPVDSTIYREYWSGFSNAFSQVGLGYGWTVGGEVRGLKARVRIDHILTDKGFAPIACRVGPDVGSDHLPVIAELASIATH